MTHTPRWRLIAPSRIMFLRSNFSAAHSCDSALNFSMKRVDSSVHRIGKSQYTGWGITLETN